MGKKRWLGAIIVFVFIAGSFSACGERDSAADSQVVTSENTDKPDVSQEQDNKETPVAEEEKSVALSVRPMLCESASLEEVSVAPCVEAYTISSDLGNVDNLWQFYYIPDEMAAKLTKNGFVVCGDAGAVLCLFG